MEEQFVPYEIALKLKELSFDQECLAVWDNQTKELFINDTKGLPIKDVPTILTVAPLYQQVFDWFRDNYQYSCEITWTNTYKQYTGYLYPLSIEKNGSKVELCGNFDKDQYHEARIACLEKLIELINE